METIKLSDKKGVVFMKKTQTTLVVMVIVSVFLLSFLIGRATALKDKAEKGGKTQIYNGTVFIPHNNEEENVETAKSVQNVPEEKKDTKKTYVEENSVTPPPERMLFPCGNKVLKEYSQLAIYSETMGDWRAHTGIDYEAEKGTEVISAWDGRVSKVYKDRLWGNTVEIEHSGGIKSIYKNLQSKIQVKEGEMVKGGQVIGKVGDSASTESREKPHLHFEIWQDGIVINPTSYVY